MTSRFKAISLLGLSLTLAACGQGTPAADPGTFSLSTLQPGQKQDIDAAVKVNVVLVGYHPTAPGQVAGPRDVNVSDFTSILPGTGRNIARIPSAYGALESTGNTYTYQYNYVYASQSFEDNFFSYLTSKGTEKPLTVYQKAYNCQSTDDLSCATPATNIARAVTGNLEIDGVLAENWLADNASSIGVDARQYTVFLVNWYGRPDFKFHSFTRADAADSDTGTKFGQRSSRRLNAWGGTPRDDGRTQRVWFYDLSANPEAWTNNWDVSNADVDGDKVPDYRMPPIWEYGTRKATYRPFTKVGPDLALVTRYVALDLLFTPSPIYRVSLTPPNMPERINLNVAFEQGAGADTQANLYRPQLSQDRLKVLQPFATLTNSIRTAPLSGEVFDAYKCLFPATDADICSPDRADPTGDRLFTYALNDVRNQYKTLSDYQVPIYAFNDGENTQPGLLGVAGDDGVTGTQAVVNSFLTPDLNAAGYGFTDTITHETGHHFSLSHPHDGYDSETNTEYGPSGEFAFVNSGDMSNTVMAYNDLTRGFGQFNLDSQYRYLTAAYLNNTDAILQLVQQAGPDKVKAVNAAATSADAQFGSALGSYRDLNYLDAATQAHAAYRSVVDAARAAGVNVQPYRWYERLDGLATQKTLPRRVNNYLPVQGTAIRPESTAFLTRLRLAK
ncbi:hypothetical protein [Deinococcus aquiradiocola]|uniref:Peptidase M43 pregnancy-associated plasma-A domain-containing protein n=1 Tax=Deinococcus aquiradiocola TaxID=393059 RepID=A0A917PJH4_9DEIO|nr:hypothetical protein [Deinococcus aquiradiocola]GGJ81338.1 hypothetical protein GCM10008939_26680 [Deinococcus aquiradiocola]